MTLMALAAVRTARGRMEATSLGGCTDWLLQRVPHRKPNTKADCPRH